MGAAAQQGTQAYNLGRLCAVAGGCQKPHRV
ncbi:MAG: acetyl-CoA C-acetyltransferase [Halioglobus sp.]|jgi:acetyl-CoA C-acetyltransferase